MSKATKPMTKAAVYEAVAAATEFSKADVKKFFEALSEIVIKQLHKKGPGAITIPGLVKLTATQKKASKGGEKKANPFKPGEFIITKPKPASVKVRARAGKAFVESLL
ncbi:HU family DNA-binding protein [Zavarzinella formosa]|uniref:HU family DNA-binding protein n=1 Tax=Zavarzinella formosa TaxID=360055 RepID=UPI00031E2560|nr:HU family DNA-binding protein [Zavarzinella formosa]